MTVMCRRCPELPVVGGAAWTLVHVHKPQSISVTPAAAKTRASPRIGSEDKRMIGASRLSSPDCHFLT